MINIAIIETTMLIRDELITKSTNSLRSIIKPLISILSLENSIFLNLKVMNNMIY